MRVRLIAALLLVVAVPLEFRQSGQDVIDRRTWRDYGGGPDNARYLTLDQITNSKSPGPIRRATISRTCSAR